MRIFCTSNNIVSPLGFTTEANLVSVKNNISGIKLIDDKECLPIPFYGSKINTDTLENSFDKYANHILHTRLEKMFICSISDAILNTNINLENENSLLIICTTKGNIDLLEPKLKKTFNESRVTLPEMGKVIGKYFKCKNQPLVISNACISGMVGIITAARMLHSGRYRNIVVSGGDIISEFTISGFQAFKAISDAPCRPFDISRNGVSLGEGCGTLAMTNDENIGLKNDSLLFAGGAISNDANHISGPSRDGGGMYISIKKALADASISSHKIDYISGHGTATIYNDEMESKAIVNAQLEHAPINSFKGYFGHTLGAAGVIESIATLYSMKENTIFTSKGFEKLGVSGNINVVNKITNTTITNTLKTGAGFGGCNASIVYSKLNQVNGK